MPNKTPAIDSPVFTIQLQKGLADRKRLPLADVLIVLDPKLGSSAGTFGLLGHIDGSTTRGIVTGI